MVLCLAADHFFSVVQESSMLKDSWPLYSSAAKHKFSQASSCEEKGSNRPEFINVQQIEMFSKLKTV